MSHAHRSIRLGLFVSALEVPGLAWAPAHVSVPPGSTLSVQKWVNGMELSWFMPPQFLWDIQQEGQMFIITCDIASMFSPCSGVCQARNIIHWKQVFATCEPKFLSVHSMFSLCLNTYFFPSSLWSYANLWNDCFVLLRCKSQECVLRS